MRFSDSISHSFSNLWRRKLRTSLTTLGVTIGIGALVSLISFGTGMQKNVTRSFESLELFNSITVFPGSVKPGEGVLEERRETSLREPRGAATVLDDQALEKLAGIKGVEAVFPDIHIPAVIRFNGREEFRLIQVIPSPVASSKLIRYAAGRSYRSDDKSSLIVSRSLLRQFKIAEPEQAVGKKLTLTSVTFDFSLLNPVDLPALLRGERLPLTAEDYEFSIAGVAENMTFGGPSPIQSDVIIPPKSAEKIKRLPFSSIWDLFRAREGQFGHTAVNVRLSSPRYVDFVKDEVSQMGFQTFSYLDQLREIRAGFLIMDMVLAAVGMIAIVVASLGIINTMVMSVLERYTEIGIMKAVGARNRDIKRTFFFESCAIGLLGGLAGLGLGWGVSRLINRVVNYFLARQGIPYIDYFSFPWWLVVGAVLFSVAVSLVSGIYPAVRAARVDPVRALRYE